MDDVARTARGESPRELVAARSGRVDAVLADALPGVSRARVQRLIADGHVFVNGDPVRKSVQVDAGDVLLVEEPERELAAPADVDFDLPVLYEDDAVLAVDKPAGLAVHGAPGDTGPSVIGWFAARLPELAGRFDAERPGVVHRLDKDTTGVLLLAKTPEAQAALGHSFEARETAKTYLAVVDGVPGKERAIIDAAIARHPGDRTRMALVKHGRASRTGYEVLGGDRDQSLLLVRPETGRTHQIRVHLAAIHCPVARDRVYGRRTAVDPGGRQLLHAYRLTVPHPDGGTVTITAPVPADMEAAIRAIGLDSLASEYAAAAPPERCPGPIATIESADLIT